MIDGDLRALEREAEHDPTAAKRLALTRFRIFGDCRTGLCGHWEAEPGNEAENNYKPRRLTVCPTCRVKRHRVLARAHAKKLTMHRRTKSLRLLLEWIDSGASWRPDTFDLEATIVTPVRSDRLWLALVCDLERLSIAWTDGDWRIRFDERPESAIPDRIRVHGRLLSDEATAWTVPTMDNEKWKKENLR